MIKLGIPYITNMENKSRICCDIKVDNNEPYKIWYEVDSQYGKYLCTERADGIIINILLYCMEHKHDIETDCSVSEKLYYQLINFLIPSIAKNIERYSSIMIKAPITSEVLPSGNAVGTGLSGGVDSFYCICKNTDKETKSFNLTHYTFFNAGASGNYGGDQARKLFNERVKEVKKFADEVKMPLITVDTNINEFLMQNHAETHTFRALSIPLILQKLFKVYYYASGFQASKFHFYSKETAYYDLFTLPCISNENISFYSVGAETDRIGKVNYISDFNFVRENLNVCVKDSKNCSKCEKCQRTMLDLYALNKLELFDKVFDVNFFYDNINKMLALVNSKHKKNIFYEEIYDQMQKSNMKIPFKAKIISKYYIIVEVLKTNKFIRKLFGKSIILK